MSSPVITGWRKGSVAGLAAFFGKPAVGRADYVFVDLEDAVAPAEKDQARKEGYLAVLGVPPRSGNGPYRPCDGAASALRLRHAHRCCVRRSSRVPLSTCTNRRRAR
jgi:hypothetical protein